MAGLRRKTPAFVYGDYQDLDPANPKIFAYTRAMGADKYLVVLNFSTDRWATRSPAQLRPAI